LKTGINVTKPLLDITKAQIEAEVHPDGATDNVWMEAMAAVDRGFHHDVLADCRKICINVTKP